MDILTFGKYNNIPLSQVPSNYLSWGATNLNSSEWKNLFEQELKKRELKKDVLTEKIINNSNDESLKQELFDYFEEYNREEDDSINDTTKIITQKVEDFILVTITDHKIKILKSIYTEKLGGNKLIIDSILSYFHNDNLTSSLFSTVEKYQLAIEFTQKFSQLATDKYYEAFFNIEDFNL